MRILISFISFLFFFNILNAQEDSLGRYSLAQLDSIYKTKKKPQEQLPYALALLQKGEKELDTKDTTYAKLHFRLGLVYQNLRDYSNAAIHLQEAIDIQKKNNAVAAQVNSLNHLAGCRYFQSNLDEAERLWFQSLAIRKRSLSKKSVDYGGNLVNLGSVCLGLGKYAKSESFYLEAIDFFEKQNLLQHQFYMNCLNNLGTLYSNQGNYTAAEKLFLQALKIRGEILGEKHAHYAASLTSLGVLYHKMGDYAKAETLYRQAMAIHKENSGEKSANYASVLNNLGVMYFDKSSYAEAESIQLQALQIKKEILGEENTEVASSLNNLGNLYQRLQKYPEAEEYLRHSIEIRKKLVGEKHPDYAGCLINLGLLFYRLKEYEKAVPLYQQALKIQRETLNKKHPDYAKNLDNLGLLYQAMGDYKKAAIYFSEVLPIHLDYLEYTGMILGEKAKQELFKTIIKDINNVNCFADRYRTHDSILALVQDGTLLTKGYSLTGATEILPLIKSLNDSTLNSIYDAWIATKFKIGNIYNMSLKEREDNARKLDSLEYLAQEQETSLMRGSTTLKERIGYHKRRFYFKDLVAVVEKDEVVIDFLFVQPNKDSLWYYALITQQGWKYPKLIPICLANHLLNYTEAEVHPYKESYITKSQWRKELYNLIINPLEPYLKNKKAIHWSPIGSLCELALGTLLNDKDKMLLEEFEIYQYSALKDFIIKKQKTEKDYSQVQNVLLVGNIAFDLNESEHFELVTHKKEEFHVSRSVPVDTTRSSFRFVPLRGTKVEVENLNKAFTAKKWTIEQLQAKEALEEHIYEHTGDNTPKVLHFATHGFFISKKRQGYDNPLLRSGIALAGANHVWMGKGQIEGIEDGLWTAYEIANTNLLNAELVVLSACETARGQIDNFEGVIGLQRSFKIAGVENMLLSLWEVPDKETVELMQEFYKYYLNGEKPAAALRKAQTVMSKKYKEPYYWGAFILIE